MRISCRKGALALAAVGVLVSSVPANAASTTWKDPEGDATTYLDVGLPRPSEPAYDVLDATLTSDGKDLTLAARFKKLGKIPPQATGNAYRFSFLAGEGRFTMSVIQDLVGGSFTAFAVRDTTTGINNAAECVKCSGKLNLQANRLEIKLPISALDSARKSAKVAGKIAPGAKLGEVLIEAGEYYNFGYSVGVGFSLSNTADEAALPAPGTFTL